MMEISTYQPSIVSIVPEFLRTEQNGIEYFTVTATGESAVSVRGLAKMSGIPKTTAIRWFADLTHESIPKWLEPLQGMPLTLTHEIKKNGKSISTIPADTAADFIMLVAENLHKKEAFATLKAITRIGLTSYIQGVTGWLPESYQSSLESRTALDRILDDATPYKVFYEPVLHEKAVKLMGVKFYWHYCYDFLTAEERCKLNRVNQQTPNGRINYIHQHINPIALKKLEKYLIQLAILVNQANNRKHFNAMYQYQFFGDRQLELDFDAN